MNTADIMIMGTFPVIPDQKAAWRSDPRRQARAEYREAKTIRTWLKKEASL